MSIPFTDNRVFCLKDNCSGRLDAITFEVTTVNKHIIQDNPIYKCSRCGREYLPYEIKICKGN